MKKETTQTPGPWHIGLRQPNSDKFVYGASGEEVANCDRLTNFPDVNLANARLIAAAPEMLEALRECVTTPGAHAFGGETTAEETRRMFQRLRAINETARAAIAKAEGRE